MKAAKDRITIVSGLPRSGTSMMMQMLEAGGMEVYTDGVRKPDESNPWGYYETARISQLAKDNSWVSECCGKVVKIVSPWLDKVPLTERYKVVFMQRPLDAILDSQRKMLERRGKTSKRNDLDLYRSFYNHLLQIESWLRLHDFDTIYIQYEEVLHNPLYYAHLVAEFLNYGLDQEKMAGAVTKKT